MVICHIVPFLTMRRIGDFMPQLKEERPDLKAIREELKISQATLASYLGVSVRTVQSCEQGWRSPGEAVKKALLLLLITHRRREELTTLHCWEDMHCSNERRERCLIYQSRQGHLCWFLHSNQCSLQPDQDWKTRQEACRQCAFFQKLIRPVDAPAAISLERRIS